MAALASLEDVTARLDFALDDPEKAAVESALEDLSEEARFYAGEYRWEDPDSTPGLVKTVVAKAVARWARNMNGYVQSRAGDETLGWAKVEAEAGSPAFSDREIKLLKAIGSGQRQPGAFGTISVVAYGPRRDARKLMEMSDNGKSMPYVDTFHEPYNDPFYDPYVW